MKYFFTLTLLGIILNMKGQKEKRFEKIIGIGSGFSVNNTSTKSEKGFIKMPNTLSIPIVVSCNLFIKPKLIICFGIARNQSNLKIKTINNYVNFPETVSSNYAHSGYYIANISLKYKIIKMKRSGVFIGLGPALFYQTKIGNLTTEIDSTTFADSAKAVNKYLYVTNATINGVSHFTLGYMLSIEMIKQISEKSSLIFGVAYQNSFSPLRRADINTTLNGAYYDNASGVFYGRSLILTFSYAFRI